MGFVVGQVHTVKRHIKFDLPSDDGKKPKKADLIVEFKVRDRETIKARQKEVQQYVRLINTEIKKAQVNPDHEINVPDEDLDEGYLLEDIVGMEGLLDLEGNELEYSEELASQVLLDRNAWRAVVASWVELNSIDGAKRKNS